MSNPISETNDTLPITVAAFYRFVAVPNFEAFREGFESVLDQHDVKGSVLLASEGINGTIAGPRAGIDAFFDHVRSFDEFKEVDIKLSYCEKQPFRRRRVRLKREIVTMGVEGIDPNRSVGTYVDPQDWNDLIRDPDVIVIDTRNDYEISIGTFERAQNPNTESFREFPEYVDENLDPAKQKKIAMFCTGGIRCEKSTALLKQKGFDEVYHLKGGILKYLETVPEEESLWRGDCFVFDNRVSVGHGLAEGKHVMCYACGWPVSEQEQQHEDYQAGVQCPNCVNEISEERKRRFAERQSMWERQGYER
ncbi:oxygen-dependent tRNA uridine(34) hydroxylase TrhO [Roseiconus lacunae]|uniref:tRNA uridine(34) hydroxylase n=1 Tax=Roseiconus lacunae TaxID=2605694 RepID=A0ABT7PHT3_9BACT|nr:rhodanese-related sulfurtransferase [Roseiconus lacunae]MCD0461229.1 rhodanese-related sulfurtransferase [Roseiconus lacunae]MDM4016055.1 rhodanese-related sulfurtransferase [Roseiconus lacunae]WRQ51611.1 rhodanese-related sulfurtransferase [Stieleria sp. HD01]